MPINDPACPRKRFLLWSWAMLFVVLLSAAPTGGAPRTQLVGSAFDPATVSVALSPRQPGTKAAIEAAARPSPDEFRGSPPALVAVVREDPAALVSAGRALPHHLVATLHHPRAYNRAHGPRAPPIA